MDAKPMNIEWSQHALDRAAERGIPIEDITKHVGTAQWMLDFKGKKFRMCWVPVEGKLVRVVYQAFHKKLLIITVYFEREDDDGTTC